MLSLLLFFTIAPSFIRPQIHPISEIDICLSYAKPKPHPFQPLPQPDNESVAIKADYQQRLVLAAQQLDPSPPSLLLCSITTPPHYEILCCSISQKSKLYGCSLNDSSIMVNSWLPMATDGHVTTNTKSCDILRGHSGPVYGLSFNRSGEFLLSASEDTSGTCTCTCTLDNDGTCTCTCTLLLIYYVLILSSSLYLLLVTL